jgi:hypothetical protein
MTGDSWLLIILTVIVASLTPCRRLADPAQNMYGGRWGEVIRVHVHTATAIFGSSIAASTPCRPASPPVSVQARRDRQDADDAWQDGRRPQGHRCLRSAGPVWRLRPMAMFLFPMAMVAMPLATAASSNSPRMAASSRPRATKDRRPAISMIRTLSRSAVPWGASMLPIASTVVSRF